MKILAAIMITSTIMETMCTENIERQQITSAVVSTKKWTIMSTTNDYESTESNKIYNHNSGSDDEEAKQDTNDQTNNNSQSEAAIAFSNEEDGLEHDVNDIEETLTTQETGETENKDKAYIDDKKIIEKIVSAEEATNSKSLGYRAVNSDEINDTKYSNEMLNKKVMKLSERRKKQRFNKDKKVLENNLANAKSNATVRTAAKKFLQHYSKLINNSKLYKLKSYNAENKIKKTSVKKYKSTAIPRRIKTSYSKEKIEDNEISPISLDNHIINREKAGIKTKRKHKKIHKITNVTRMYDSHDHTDEKVFNNDGVKKKKFVRMNKKHPKNIKNFLDVEELLKNMTKSSIIDDITEYLLDNVMRKYEDKIRKKYNNMKDDDTENPVERFEIIL